MQSSDAESDNPIERPACRPLEMAEPAGSVDVFFGSTPSSTKSHAAPIARVRLAPARHLVRTHRHDAVVDCRSRLFCVAQGRHPADGRNASRLREARGRLAHGVRPHDEPAAARPETDSTTVRRATAATSDAGTARTDNCRQSAGDRFDQRERTRGGRAACCGAASGYASRETSECSPPSRNARETTGSEATATCRTATRAGSCTGGRRRARLCA